MKRLLRDVSFTGASQVIAAAAAVALQIVLARTLPLSVFGAFAVTQAAVVLVESIFIARNGEVALYWVGRSWGVDPQAARGYANYLVRREYLWNLSVYALLIATAWPLHALLGVDPWFFCIYGLTIPVQSGYGVTKSVFIAAGRVRTQSLFEAACSLCQLFGVGLLTLSLGLEGFVWGMVAVALWKTVAARRLTAKFWPAVTRGDEVAIPAGRGESVYAVLRNLSSNIAQQADVLILGAMASKETVAIYKIARSLASLPGRLAGPVWTALRPRFLAALRDRDMAQLRRMALRPALAFGVMGLLAAPAIGLWIDDIVVLLYGQAYRASVTPLLILLAATWWLHMITGWFGFLSILSESKPATTALYVLLALATVAGAFISGPSVIHLAAAVAGAMVLTAAAAWSLLWHPHVFIRH